MTSFFDKSKSGKVDNTCTKENNRKNEKDLQTITVASQLFEPREFENWYALKGFYSRISAG